LQNHFTPPAKSAGAPSSWTNIYYLTSSATASSSSGKLYSQEVNVHLSS
jgi:hypothetical protein